MSNFGTEYSALYDLFHAGKNYSEEVDNVVSTLGINRNFEKVLDFGCGSGIHASEFSRRGYNVEGYDVSLDMINQARLRNPKLTFETSLDKLHPGYDLIYSLFDVMSYQVTYENLKEYFSQISSMLRIDGFAIVDSWHSSGVRMSPPVVTRRIVAWENAEYERLVEPVDSGISDQYDLKITVRNVSENYLLTSELHKLRAWSIQEVEEALTGTGLRVTSVFDPKTPNQPPTESSWRFGVILAKPKAL